MVFAENSDEKKADFARSLPGKTLNFGKMNKKFLLLTTCIVTVILAVVTICVFVSGNYYLNIMDTKMNDINIKLDNLHIHNSDLTYNI